MYALALALALLAPETQRAETIPLRCMDASHLESALVAYAQTHPLPQGLVAWSPSLGNNSLTVVGSGSAIQEFRDLVVRVDVPALQLAVRMERARLRPEAAESVPGTMARLSPNGALWTVAVLVGRERLSLFEGAQALHASMTTTDSDRPVDPHAFRQGAPPLPTVTAHVNGDGTISLLVALQMYGGEAAPGDAGVRLLRTVRSGDTLLLLPEGGAPALAITPVILPRVVETPAPAAGQPVALPAAR